jgi:cytochrome c oxidase subunit 3
MSAVKSYYLPEPTRWPIFGSTALLLMGVGAASWVNHAAAGPYIVCAGLGFLLLMLMGWFGTVIGENNRRLYNGQVDASFRLGMAWFIFTEAMVFAALFGALFYLRVLAVPDLGSGETAQLWPGFHGVWPTAGPDFKGTLTRMSTWDVPAINTLILLSSGAAVTWANSAITRGRLGQFKAGLLLTITLGVLFLCLQVSEYHHAFTKLDLTLATGVYGATFFALTGLHGFHVALGTLVLIVMLVRTLLGHFTQEHHFAFTAASWYWHFVGIVWVILFVLVYWI